MTITTKTHEVKIDVTNVSPARRCVEAKGLTSNAHLQLLTIESNGGSTPILTAKGGGKIYSGPFTAFSHQFHFDSLMDTADQTAESVAQLCVGLSRLRLGIASRLIHKNAGEKMHGMITERFGEEMANLIQTIFMTINAELKEIAEQDVQQTMTIDEMKGGEPSLGIILVDENGVAHLSLEQILRML